MSSKPKFKLNLSLSNYIRTQKLPPPTGALFYMDFETAGLNPTTMKDIKPATSAQITSMLRILKNSVYGSFGKAKIYQWPNDEPYCGKFYTPKR